MRYSILTQAAFILVALIIIFGFIKPTFAKIGVTQDQLFQYKDAVSKATELNARLQSLVGIKNSFTPEQIQRLELFLPNTIDRLSVMNDIESIFESLNLDVTSITAKDVVVPSGDLSATGADMLKKDIPQESYQDFTVTFTGTYEDLKNVLQSAEANTTLLEVVDLSFSTLPDTAVSRDGNASSNANGATPNGFHKFTITFRSYAIGSLSSASAATK